MSVDALRVTSISCVGCVTPGCVGGCAGAGVGVGVGVSGLVVRGAGAGVSESDSSIIGASSLSLAVYMASMTALCCSESRSTHIVSKKSVHPRKSFVVMISNWCSVSTGRKNSSGMSEVVLFKRSISCVRSCNLALTRGGWYGAKSVSVLRLLRLVLLYSGTGLREGSCMSGPSPFIDWCDREVEGGHARSSIGDDGDRRFPVVEVCPSSLLAPVCDDDAIVTRIEARNASAAARFVEF
jgi:hypothetical protein